MAKEWFWLPDRPTIIYCLAKGCDQHPLKTLHATGWLWRQSTWFRQENAVCHAVCGTCHLKFNKDYLLLPLLITSLEQRPQPIPLLWGQVCLPFLISNCTIYGKGELLIAVEKCIKQELLFQGAHRREAAESVCLKRRIPKEIPPSHSLSSFPFCVRANGELPLRFLCTTTTEIVCMEQLTMPFLQGLISGKQLETTPHLDKKSKVARKEDKHVGWELPWVGDTFVQVTILCVLY